MSLPLWAQYLIVSLVALGCGIASIIYPDELYGRRTVPENLTKALAYFFGVLGILIGLGTIYLGFGA